MRKDGRAAFWRRGLWVFAALLCYLAPASRLETVLVRWAEHEEHHAGEEIFPCAVHKCQCKNALECRVRCCCFPKMRVDAQGHSGSDPAGDIRACGGPRDEAALASLPPHLVVPGPVLFLPSAFQALGEGPDPALSDPDPSPPSKIPIPA